MEVLSHFHQFCISNNLHYTMASGSLIGTIRHKGFIPWDDDIDIYMIRPEYEKFIKLYQDTEQYACFSSERGDALITWARICDMKKTTSWSNFPWIEKDTGVYISIFPIDGSDSSYESLIHRFMRCNKLFDKNYMLRYLIRKNSTAINIWRNVEVILKRIRNGRSRKNIISQIKKNRDSHINLCKEIEYQSSEFVADLSFASKDFVPKCLWNKCDFENYTTADFENQKVMIIAGYDNNLRNVYGDYMELPPVEKRIPVHGHTVYFWK